MELDDFLRELLSHLENNYNSGKNKNSEIQVGFCRTNGDKIIYISGNAGIGKGQAAIDFNYKKIEEFVNSKLRVANDDSGTLKIKIVNRPQGLNGCLHAEMNIIRQMLDDLCATPDYTKHTTLYLKGKKCPCKKCKEFIDCLNSLTSHFLTVNVLQATEDVSQRQYPTMWDNPMNYLTKDRILSILSECDYNTLCSVKDIK
jgi:deoxycytidylate deaminase